MTALSMILDENDKFETDRQFCRTLLSKFSCIY